MFQNTASTEFPCSVDSTYKEQLPFVVYGLEQNSAVQLFVKLRLVSNLLVE